MNVFSLSMVVATAVVFSSLAPLHRISRAIPALTAQEADGKALYAKNCKQCHGVLGAPTKAARQQYKNIATFVDSAFFATHPHKEFISAITNGKGDMLPFKDKLTAAEIEATVKYIHTLAKKS